MLVHHIATRLPDDVIQTVQNAGGHVVQTFDLDTCERWLAALSAAARLYPEAHLCLLPGDFALSHEAQESLEQMIGKIGDADMIIGSVQDGLVEPYSRKQLLELTPDTGITAVNKQERQAF